MSFTPSIYGYKTINNSISIKKNDYIDSQTRGTFCETIDRYQKYFGSYPSDNSFVWFLNPPRELEWEYNKERFAG